MVYFDPAFFEALIAVADVARLKLKANGVSLEVVRDGEVVYPTGIGQTSEGGAEVTSSTRMMMLDANNLEIADLMLDWAGKQLAKAPKR